MIIIELTDEELNQIESLVKNVDDINFDKTVDAINRVRQYWRAALRLRFSTSRRSWWTKSAWTGKSIYWRG